MPDASGSRVVIAGGSGFLGRAIASELRLAGYTPLILGRSSKSDLEWDAKNLGPWAAELDGAAGLINLVGESISLPWTPENRKKILDSRVESTSVLAQALARLQQPPKVWLNASGVGVYGNRGDAVLTEEDAPGTGFLVDVVCAWEAAMFSAPLPHIRRNAMRLGVVIGKDGGAFPTLAKLTRSFLGGAQGDGQQWFAWVEVSDAARMFVHALREPLEGPINAVSPNPVRNGEFMEELRAAVGRPWSPPAPKFGLKLASLFGAPDPELVLDSVRAMPEKLNRSGFVPKFSEIRGAIKAHV